MRPASRAARSYRMVACLGTALACACGEPDDVVLPGDEEVPEIVGVVDRSFDRAVEDVAWGIIGGIALSQRGEIAVADYSHGRILLLRTDGAVRFVLPGADDVPSVPAMPCCVAFGPADRLWVREGGKRRYSIFRLTGDGLVLDHTLPITHAAAGMWARTTFDAGGRLIDVGVRAKSATADMAMVRYHRDDAGATRAQLVIAPPPAGAIPMVAVEVANDTVSTQRYYHGPFGPAQLLAHGPAGQWAVAISSAYDVTWRDASGNILHRLARESRGPSLTRSERAQAKRSLREDSRAAGRKLPFEVPVTKPPLRALYFDAQGRLWVERSTRMGSGRTADVYVDGRLVAIAHWADDVDLDAGAVAPSYAIGVRTDDLGAQRPVRMILKPSPARVASAVRASR